MRVVIRSAAIQDRDGAGLVFNKIRRRFPWLELIWADGGDAAVARCRCCAWRSSSGATTRRASSFCRAVGWSSAPSPGSDATGVSPRTSRTLPKPWAPSLLSAPSSMPSGGLPERRSPTQQTAGLHGTVVKVGKSDREGTVAGTHGNGEVAPNPDLAALASERGNSTLLGHSASHFGTALPVKGFRTPARH